MVDPVFIFKRRSVIDIFVLLYRWHCCCTEIVLTTINLCQMSEEIFYCVQLL